MVFLENLIFIPNRASNNVHIVDRSYNDAISSVSVGKNPGAICVGKDKVYVANEADPSISILDWTGRLLGNLALPENRPPGRIGANQTSEMVYIIHEEAGGLTALQGWDADNDGLYDEVDNCATHFNPEQLDFDGDGIGDSCDGLPGEPCGTIVTDTNTDGSKAAALLLPLFTILAGLLIATKLQGRNKA